MIQLFDIKTRTLSFDFCRTPKKVLTKISHPKKVTSKFQTQKKSSDRKFQTQKWASHIPTLRTSLIYLSTFPRALNSFGAQISDRKVIVFIKGWGLHCTRISSWIFLYFNVSVRQFFISMRRNYENAKLTEFIARV